MNQVFLWKSGPAELKSPGYFVNASNLEKFCGQGVILEFFAGIWPNELLVL
jgi:hypothetical protein